MFQHTLPMRLLLSNHRARKASMEQRIQYSIYIPELALSYRPVSFDHCSAVFRLTSWTSRMEATMPGCLQNVNVGQWQLFMTAFIYLYRFLYSSTFTFSRHPTEYNSRSVSRFSCLSEQLESLTVCSTAASSPFTPSWTKLAKRGRLAVCAKRQASTESNVRSIRILPYLQEAHIVHGHVCGMG
ncbi:uncharacterized protein BO66DRAFT_39567 [Aspergillus aculeatinus CBS 121060]|uniref:Uncharacterized protein n=1 Tax=Aspergillus aculeatinus CBS 121060 TaxID=1448322 RepID=A0ACD1HFL0_9EURO|nr:hypothetical protein BO66DRAFT_39567 [Aspergillus aculeatinus CBS 121060]RAH72188.1 hypothetical protein BO66DRAFT_39567 [Aspergillus aculeatinus CBS 121060]